MSTGGVIKPVTIDAMSFSAYEPYHYGDTALVTPNDEGALVVIAIATNFLLVTDGPAVLRYST